MRRSNCALDCESRAEREGCHKHFHGKDVQEFRQIRGFCVQKRPGITAAASALNPIKRPGHGSSSFLDDVKKEKRYAVMDFKRFVGIIQIYYPPADAVKGFVQIDFLPISLKNAG